MQFNTQAMRRGIALTGLLAGMALAAGNVLAQQDGTNGPSPKMRERMEERCKANPQKCEEMKKRFEERQAACKQDPVACKQKREAMHEKMKQMRKEHHEKCQQDPVACKKERAERRQKMEERCKADLQKCEEWKKNHPHHHGDKAAPPIAPATN